MKDDSTLVLIQPDDSIERIAERVRQADTQQVQLLVPADTFALRNRHAMSDLRRQLGEEGISISIISSGEHVLQAARQSGIESLAVDGTQVSGPLLPGQSRRKAPARPRADNMRFLMGLLKADTSAAERLDRPSPRPKITRPIPTEPASDKLAAEAATLDQLDNGRIPDRYSALSAADADLYSSFDDLSDAIQQEAAKPRPEPRTRPVEEKQAEAAITRAAERGRDRTESSRSARATEEIRSPRRVLEEDRSPERTSSRRARRLPVQLGDRTASRRKTDLSFLLPLLLLIGLLAAIAFGIYWFFNSRAAVTIYPPADRMRELPITDVVIPYKADPGNDSTMIQAIPVSVDASYTVSGSVAEQVVSPSNRARGTVTMINTLGQAINLPEGTEFIARNAAGADVRFVIDTPATLPGSSTTSSLTGSSTNYGQAQVAVTARSAGAASNVLENSIDRILVPGQQLLDCRSSSVICRNEALGGGSDEPQWIVTEADVNRTLSDALTGLYNAGVQQLRAQVDGVNTVIDERTLSPGPQKLGLPESYEPPIVFPAIGQPTGSATNSFTMTVKARFNALATSPQAFVKTQLETIAGPYLTQNASQKCSTSEQMQPRIDTYTWDGASLKINGTLICTPTGGFSENTRLRVRDALTGKSREQATAALQALKDEGLIGEFELPNDVQQMPPLDILLNVQFADSPAP